MTKNKKAYFALHQNGIVLVEVPNRLGISPKADEKARKCVLAAQDFFDSVGYGDKIVVYALSTRPDLEYRLAVSINSNSHYIPHIYASYDLSGSEATAPVLQQGNTGKMPEATVEKSLTAVLNWAQPFIKKDGRESLDELAENNFESGIYIPFLGRVVGRHH